MLVLISIYSAIRFLNITSGLFCIGLAAGICMLSGCGSQTDTERSNENNKTSATDEVDTLSVKTQEQPVELRNIFTYHKQFKVNDSLVFDVLEWGAANKGSYLVLKSSRPTNNYFSISGQRTGKIVNAYITDMDADMQLEVTIITKDNDDNKGNVYSHEIDSLNQQSNITLPELSPELKSGYIGNDTFFISQDKLIHKFHINAKNKTADSNDAIRQIEYVFRNNTFILSGSNEN